MCVLPGCTTSVDNPGDTCADCRAAFGDFLRPCGGPPLTREQIQERDSFVTRAYHLQRQLR